MGKSSRVVRAPRGFPKKVDILGQTWKVKYVRGMLEHQSLYGLTVMPRRTIFIDADQSSESMTDTLLHECLHGMLHVVGHIDMNEKLEERVCRNLAPSIIHFVRNNKTWW